MFSALKQLLLDQTKQNGYQTIPFSVYIDNLMFVFILCVLAALTLCVVSLATLTHCVCCLTKKFQHVCNMLVFTCRYNTWHVLFEVQHTACVVLF